MADAEGPVMKRARVGDLPNMVDGEEKLDAERTETTRDVPVPGSTSHAASPPTREESEDELFRDAEPAVQIVLQEGVFRTGVPAPTVPATPAAQKLLQHSSRAGDGRWLRARSSIGKVGQQGSHPS